MGVFEPASGVQVIVVIWKNPSNTSSSERSRACLKCEGICWRLSIAITLLTTLSALAANMSTL